MNYVDSLNIFGVEAKEIPCIKGSTAPTRLTVGAVGLFYMDTSTGEVYKCVAVNENNYTWEVIGSSNHGSNDIFDLKSNLTAHTNNKSNPHGVTASQVGADASGTAINLISEHNTDITAHADIREQIGKLSSEIVDLKAFVTPQMYGAKADGVTDDTEAINDAIEAAGSGVVYFPDGIYLVSSSMDSALSEGTRFTAIKIYQKENLKLVLSSNAHIKHRVQTEDELLAWKTARYYVIGITDSTNIQVVGGIIEGEADEHIALYKDREDVFWWQGDGTYSRGHGYGICVRGSKNIRIDGCEVFNCFGDSLNISVNNNGDKNDSVIIENCILHDSTRQGISVTGGDNTIVRDCEIYNISGNAPQSGIDFEPNYVEQMNINSIVENCYIHDCAGYALVSAKANQGTKIINCVLYGGVTSTCDDTHSVEYRDCDILAYYSSNAYRNILYNCRIANCGMYEAGDDFYDCIFNPDLFNYAIDNYGSTVPSLLEAGSNILGNSLSRFYRCEFVADNSGGYASNFMLWRNNGKIGSVLFDSCKFYVGLHAYQGIAISVLNDLDMVKCVFTTNEETYNKQFIELNVPNRLQFKDNTIDIRNLMTYSPCAAIIRMHTKDTYIEANQFLASTKVSLYTIEQEFGSSIGEIYVLRNYMPLWNVLGMLASSTASKFISAGNILSTTQNEVVFTAADKEKLDNLEQGPAGKSTYDIYVDNGGTLSETEWLAGIASVAPVYASGVEEMTDTSKVYIGPEGTLWGQVRQETIVNENVFDPSKATLKAFFDSEGSINTTNAGALYYCITDYLPFDGSSAESYTMRYISDTDTRLENNYTRLCYYDNDKTFLKQVYVKSGYNTSGVYYEKNEDGSFTLELNKFLNGNAIPSTIISATRYIRMSFSLGTGKGATIEDAANTKIYFDTNAETVNSYQWADTGIQYAHYVLTDTDCEKIAEQAPDWAKGPKGDTPVKGVDYFDGKDGKDGYTPQKGIDYFDGQDGSSGKDGYTPVRGVDYWTDADKAETEAYIDTELAKRGQLKPEFAQTVEDCTDTTKLYVLPDGMIYAYMYAEVKVGGYVNMIDTASSDFKAGQRYNASAAITASSIEKDESFVSNMFAVKTGDVLRIRGVRTSTSTTATAPVFVSSRLNAEGGPAETTANQNMYLAKPLGISVTAGQQCWNNAVQTLSDGTIVWVFAENDLGSNWGDQAVNTRIAGVATDGFENIIVTINEEIREPEIIKQYQWASTGLAFVPADYEDRIIALEAKDAEIREEIANLQEQIDSGAASAKSGARWFALGDSITQGYASAVDETATSGYRQFLNINEAERWVNIVADKNGYELTNYGVGGSGYAHSSNNVRKQVAAIDFSQCDFVTLAYGVNDWKGKATLGSMEDDVDTVDAFVPNMRYAIKKILTDNPYCKIFVITPLNCRSLGTYDTNWGINYLKPENASGPGLEDIFQLEKTVCEYHGIELIDMTHCSIINRENIKTMLPDYVHPTVECHRMMARELAQKIAFR